MFGHHSARKKVMLFTWKVPFAVCESVAPVKFQEYGIPKEHIAYVTSVLMSPGDPEGNHGEAAFRWATGITFGSLGYVWVGNIELVITR